MGSGLRSAETMTVRAVQRRGSLMAKDRQDWQMVDTRKENDVLSLLQAPQEKISRRISSGSTSMGASGRGSSALWK